jgi:glycerol-3-phosphate dehydrogenase
MNSEFFDAIVIGGGITGAGVLRDLALRGAKTVLVEKGELGQATTASSSQLIHGGLRYLLYDRLTTHATCWDSGHIVRIARPLLTRLPILWPVYRDHRRGLETVETLLESYDGFQRMKEGKKHLRLSALETRRLVPGLKEDGLVGGLLFDEYEVDAVQLVRANVASAVGAGATVRTNTDVTGFAFGPQKIGVRLRLSEGKEEILWASVVVNAAGPWAGTVAALAQAEVSLRLQKGSHLVYKKPLVALGATPCRVGLLLEAVDRERYIFILPGQGKTLVGPTDIPGTEGPDLLKTTTDEVRYLLDSCHRYFPSFPEHYDGTTVGVRPMLGQKGPEKLLSRGFRVMDHGREGGPARLVTVAGGKMSDFRLMGEEAADAACRWIGISGASTTAAIALDGKRAAGIVSGGPPSARLKIFLDLHPRVRELDALAHLGLAYVRHMFSRKKESALSDVFAQYEEKP